MKKLISLLLSCLLLLTLPVSAQSGALSADYDILSDGVEGSLSSAAPATVYALFCVKGDSAGEILADFDSIESSAAFYEHYISDASGKIDFSFSFSDEMPIGNYVIVVTDGKSLYEYSFLRYSEEAVKENLRKLNKKTTLSEFSDYLWTLFEDSQLPTSPKEYTLTDSFKESVANSLFNNKTEEPAEFKTRFDELYLSDNLASCERGEYIDFLQSNAEKLDIDESYIENLSAKQKIYFLDLLVGKGFETVEEFKGIYENAIILTLTSKAENYQEIKNAIEKFNIEVDFEGDYKKVKDSSKVYKKMMGKSYESIEDIIDAFSDAVDEVIKEQKKSSSESGGSSSGGGGYVGSTGGGKVPGVPAPVVSVIPFGDLSSVSWAKDAIDALQKKGVLSGDGSGNFYPERAVTRSEFIKMLIASFDLEDAKAEILFDDISKEGWEYKYIAAAFSLGIIKGKNDTHFGGSDFITREDMSLIIYRLASLIGVSFKEKASFADSADISEYANEAVSLMAGEGLIKGDGENFSPKDNASRAQCAVIISRLMEKAGANK